MWSRVREAHSATKKGLAEVLRAEAESTGHQEATSTADQLLQRLLDRGELSSNTPDPFHEEQHRKIIRLLLSAQELVEALDVAGIPDDAVRQQESTELSVPQVDQGGAVVDDDEEDPYPIPPSSFIPNSQRPGTITLPTTGSEPSTRSSSPVSATEEDTDPRPEVKHSAGTTIIDDQGLELLCDYEIIRPVGKGTFGSVSLVADSDGNLFAIKTLHQDPRRRVLFPASPFPSSRFSSPSLPNAESNTSGTIPKNDEATSPKFQVPPLQASTHLSASANHATRNPAIEREIAVMKKLRHPNIVQLHSVIEDPYELQTHLVMQYIDNGPLGVLSAEGLCEPRPPLTAFRYMRQVARGLAYLHQCGIAHCDLKPENILISSDDVAFISDFGLSKMLDGTSNIHSGSEENQETTSVGRMLARNHSANRRSNFGTLAFCPPELLLEEEQREKKHDEVQKSGRRTLSEHDFHQADIWAFGVTLYCTLFGKLPFFGATTNELIKSILTCPLDIPTYFPTNPNECTNGAENLPSRPPPGFQNLRSLKLDSANPTPVPKQLHDLLGRLLAKDPEKRMPLEAFRRLRIVRHPEKYFSSISHPNRAEKQPDLSTQLVPLIGSLSTLSAADCGVSQKSLASIETPPQDRTPLQDCTSTSPTVPICIGSPQAFGSTPDSVPFPSFRGDSIEGADSPQVSLALAQANRAFEPNSVLTGALGKGSSKGLLPPTASTPSGSKLQPTEGSSQLHLSDSFAMSSTSIPTVGSPTMSEMNHAITYRCITFRRKLQTAEALPEPPKRPARIGGEMQAQIDASPSNQVDDDDMSPLPLPSVPVDLTPRTESCFVERLRTIVSRESSCDS